MCTLDALNDTVGRARLKSMEWKETRHYFHFHCAVVHDGYRQNFGYIDVSGLINDDAELALPDVLSMVTLEVWVQHFIH